LIGDAITVTVCEIRGDKVRIGIDAPEDIPIIRPDAVDKTATGKLVRQLMATGKTLHEIEAMLDAREN
jgi:carbon storage regulator